jgi:hypothetical protein
MPPTEDAEQRTLISWCRWMEGQHPEIGMIFHIPNGEYRTMTSGKRLKAQGVRAGIPDLFLAVTTTKFSGLWIELKSQKGKVRPEQQEWITKLRLHGYAAYVCYGWKSAAETICEYLSIPDPFAARNSL